MSKIKTWLYLIIFLQVLPPAAVAKTNDKELRIFTTRKAEFLAPIIKQYQSFTKVKISTTYGSSSELLTQLANTNASDHPDIFLSKSASILSDLDSQDLLLPVESTQLLDNVPLHLRSRRGTWYGLSIRGRTLIYNTKKVKPTMLSSYVGIAAPQWRGKLCMRTGKSTYNIALIASLIHHHGYQKAKKILTSWKNNLAKPFTNSDRNAIKAVAQGDCYITIANHYYFANMKHHDSSLNISLYWPNQKSHGVHMGLAGAAVLKGSTNQIQAKLFIEWLTTIKAQALITEHTHEFPVNPNAPYSEISRSLGRFRMDSTPIESLAKLHKQASELVNETGFY